MVAESKGSVGENGRKPSQFTMLVAGAAGLLLIIFAVLDESEALWATLFSWSGDMVVYFIGAILACFAFTRYLRLRPFKGWSISYLAQLLIFLAIVGVPAFLLGYLAR